MMALAGRLGPDREMGAVPVKHPKHRSTLRIRHIQMVLVVKRSNTVTSGPVHGAEPVGPLTYQRPVNIPKGYNV